MIAGAPQARLETADRDGLERLCRSVTRPSIKRERHAPAPDGKVIVAR